MNSIISLGTGAASPSERTPSFLANASGTIGSFIRVRLGVAGTELFVELVMSADHYQQLCDENALITGTPVDSANGAENP